MSATHEVRGVGHSVKRKEDARFIRGRGQYFDDITLPGRRIRPKRRTSCS